MLKKKNSVQPIETTLKMLQDRHGRLNHHDNLTEGEEVYLLFKMVQVLPDLLKRVKKRVVRWKQTTGVSS
ncbi:Hypp6077 [Branchiostoma lanceolatum]|uniref:Hypp6077 protein n=1 Tax=Branchiostoma lanceolatum TaxID=7740 RepID=A0A8J9VIR8_BRALA|nr:Hypp6077 [Branchiostoma lanceolatum]